MMRFCFVLALLFGAAAFLLPEALLAQQAKKETLKPGKDEKVCRVKMIPSGEMRSWICKRDQPCCVWHEINYVKCGTSFTGCL